MANLKSAIKRITINKRQRQANKIYLSQIKTFTKRYLQSLEQYNRNPSEPNYRVVNYSLAQVYSKIDKAAKKRILHKNTAARKKSYLRRQLNQLTFVN